MRWVDSLTPWLGRSQVTSTRRSSELRRSHFLLSLTFRTNRNRTRSNQNFTPISAASYFSQALQVAPTSSPCDFRVYYTPCDPSFIESMPGKMKPRAALLVCHHGAGSAATTFAPLAKEVTEASQGGLGVLAFDSRGHGEQPSIQCHRTQNSLPYTQVKLPLQLQHRNSNYPLTTSKRTLSL